MTRTTARDSKQAKTAAFMPPDMKVLMNHVYEYKKGVRQLILFTFKKSYIDFAVERMEREHIPYIIQEAGKCNLNLYFGRQECLDAIRLFVNRPLHELTPEEDFILGAMLGYDICAQCQRYCSRKKKCRKADGMQRAV